jgi:cytochrome c oxidase subunit IV
MNHHAHVTPVRTNLIVFGVLMGLLLVTVVAAYIMPESIGIAVAMLIATVKAVVVLLYFMHVRFSSRLTQVFAGAAFLWLGIMLVLGVTDYLSRGWLPVPGK